MLFALQWISKKWHFDFSNFIHEASFRWKIFDWHQFLTLLRYIWPPNWHKIGCFRWTYFSMYVILLGFLRSLGLNFGYYLREYSSTRIKWSQQSWNTNFFTCITLSINGHFNETFIEVFILQNEHIIYWHFYNELHDKNSSIISIKSNLIPGSFQQLERRFEDLENDCGGCKIDDFQNNAKHKLERFKVMICSV